MKLEVISGAFNITVTVTDELHKNVDANPCVIKVFTVHLLINIHRFKS